MSGVRAITNDYDFLESLKLVSTTATAANIDCHTLTRPPPQSNTFDVLGSTAYRLSRE